MKKQNKLNNPITDILIIPSNLNELNQVVDFSKRISQKANLTQEQSDNLAIVLTELVNNAIIHGNKMISSKRVYLTSKIYSDRLEVYIRDQGSGFEPSKIENPTNPENIWKENGRGIFLVQNLIDEVEFLRSNSGMCIKIVEYFSSKE